MRLRPATGATLRRLVSAAVIGVATTLGAGSSGGAEAPHSLLFTFARPAQTGSAFKPEAIQAAYDYTPLYQRNIDGTGQTIAFIELGAINPDDLAQFDLANNLTTPQITDHYVGTNSSSIRYDPETTMDVEWAHALAPGAAIQLYYVLNSNKSRVLWQTFATALQQAAANGAGIISISLGTCKPSTGYEVATVELAALFKQKISVFVASGDNGDRPGTVKDCGRALGVQYPASDPSVVAVGGTSVELNADHTIADETGWNLSGGGRAAVLLRRVWETAPTLPADSARWAPDVSFLADPGGRVYYHGRWELLGGTSLGAPAWAAAWALILQDATNRGRHPSAAPKVLYRIGNSAAYASAFHDIQTGSNGRYSAGPGWDAVTGWGTPDVANLDAAILGG